jgi:hypothetical protein
MTVLIVFALSFVQNYLATRQISLIAEGDPIKAALWAGLSSTASCVIAILIVVTAHRWSLLGPYVLGDVIATYVALCRK